MDQSWTVWSMMVDDVIVLPLLVVVVEKSRHIVDNCPMIKPCWVVVVDPSWPSNKYWFDSPLRLTQYYRWPELARQAKLNFWCYLRTVVDQGWPGKQGWIAIAIVDPSWPGNQDCINWGELSTMIDPSWPTNKCWIDRGVLYCMCIQYHSWPGVAR